MTDPHLDNFSNGNDANRQSLSPNQSDFSVEDSLGHPAHKETRPLQESSLASDTTNASSSHTLDGTPQPAHPAPSPSVSPTADAPYNPPINPPINPADMPSTSSSSPASPAIPTNASPVNDSSTRLPAIQTVQTYLTHQAEAVQSHLIAVLPGLVQEEVRLRCVQLAQEIGAQISSIREELIRPIGDQDDPMLSSSEEGENEGSRGRAKQSSHDKGKEKGRKFAMESDNEAACTHRHHQRPQQPNNGDEADDEDEGGDDEEETSAGIRKYKKQIQALRVVLILALHNEY
jgi:hypothetical protein